MYRVEILQFRVFQLSFSALTPENQGDGIKDRVKYAATFYRPSLGQGGKMEEEVLRTDKTGYKGQ